LNILFYTVTGDGARWVDALSRELPRASICVWPEAGKPIDYAVVWKPPPELIAGLSGARAVFNLGAGVDAIAGLSAWPEGVPLIRLEDAGMAEQMTEYVTYAVLRQYREFDAYERAQSAAEWRPRRRRDKAAFDIGILGMGVLGRAVANALLALAFPVSCCSRTSKQLPNVASFAHNEMDAFLAIPRVLVCLLPLTPETRGILDRERLARLPRGAYVINVARGALVVEADLLALIDGGHLSGAMLDVFHDEPLPSGHAFWHHPRITVTPHVSAMTQIDESVAQIAAKIRRLEAGLPVSGLVDPARRY
jgi:glyoxylate/hydroxypyruvate reductase A